METLVETAFRRMDQSDKTEIIIKFIGIYHDEHKENLLTNKQFIKTAKNNLKNYRGLTLQERREFIKKYFLDDINRLLKGIKLPNKRYTDLLDSIYNNVWYIHPTNPAFKQLGNYQISTYKRLFKQKSSLLDCGLNFLIDEREAR